MNKNFVLQQLLDPYSTQHANNRLQEKFLYKNPTDIGNRKIWCHLLCYFFRLLARRCLSYMETEKKRRVLRVITPVGDGCSHRSFNYMMKRVVVVFL